MDLTIDEAAAALVDKGLFEFGGPTDIERVRVVEQKLGERFPAQYVAWLLHYGGGGAIGSGISGVLPDPDEIAHGTVLGDTLRERNLFGLPEGLVVLLPNEDDVPWCLATQPSPDGSFPVVAAASGKIKPLYDDFNAFFGDYVVAWAQDVGSELRDRRPRRRD